MIAMNVASYYLLWFFELVDSPRVMCTLFIGLLFHGGLNIALTKTH